MVSIGLGEFIGAHRDELVRRCEGKVMQRSGPKPARLEIERGIPLFLDQIVNQLGSGPSNTREMSASATQHGHDLFVDGFTVGQLVHDYGNVCQSITDLALEVNAPISTDDFRTLNRCLDDAIAGAVAEYANQERVAGDGDALRLRKLTYTAITAFDVIQTGTVGVGGTTGDLVRRSLIAIQSLVEPPPS
jgi:hypothetical protein